MTKELNDAQIRLMQDTSLNLSAVEMTMRLLESSDIKVSTLEEFLELKDRVKQALFKEVEDEIAKGLKEKESFKVVPMKGLDS